MELNEFAAMRSAEDRHWWYLGLHELVVSLVRTEGERLARPLTLLDAGCGTGRLCELLQPFGEAVGCDVHPVALEATAQRGIRRVLHCDLVSDAFGCEQYDVITAIDVLYHRMVTDELAVLCNLHRAMRYGGLLILQVAAFESLRGAHDEAVHTRRRYRKNEVLSLLTAAGFEVKLDSYRVCPFVIPALLWRSLSRLLRIRGGDLGRGSSGAVGASQYGNRFLALCLKTENRFLRAGVPLPIGMSVFATARRPW